MQSDAERPKRRKSGAYEPGVDPVGVTVLDHRPKVFAEFFRFLQKIDEVLEADREARETAASLIAGAC